MNINLLNVFNDPSSPWYYVIGVIFLLLVFGALALYIVLSKKYGKKPQDENSTPQTDTTDASPDANEDGGEPNVDLDTVTDTAPQDEKDKDDDNR